MGMGTPGREAAFPSSTQLPGSALAVRVGLFPCSAGRPFPRPGLRSGTGVARRGGQGRARARPTGLVLDGPEHGARLGRSRDAGGLPRVVVVGEAVRKRTQPSALATTPASTRRRQARGQAAHSLLTRPSNTVTGATSNSVSRLTYPARWFPYWDAARQRNGFAERQTLLLTAGATPLPKSPSEVREDTASSLGFRPHAIIVTDRSVPSPIFVAALVGVEKILRIDFDTSLPEETYVHQALAELPEQTIAFGRPTGVTVNYAQDHAVRYDLKANPIETLTEAVRCGIASFTISPSKKDVSVRIGKALGLRKISHLEVE